MVDYKHNQPYYELHLSNLKDGTVKVLSFEAEEEISNLFEYRIELVSDDPEIDSSKVLNNQATFFLNRGDEDPVKIHGIISGFEQYGKTSDYVFYKAVLVPQIWRLNLVFQNEVYQHINIEKIIEMMLEDIGLSKQSLKIDLKNKYPEKEYLVQYRETNFNFLNRRLEHFGIYYYFDHSDDKDVIVFTDSNSKLPSIPLEENIGYNINKDPFSEKESIWEITCKEKVVTGMVQLKDYNYMFPEKQLMGQSQIDEHPGLYYDYGDDFENEKDAESLAKVRNQEFLAGSKIFNGKSDCRYFSAGYKFKLDKHYRKSWNSEYVITKVKHIGNQQGLFGLLPASSKLLPTYENIFTAIPLEIEYRPSRKTTVPKITGIMSAKIDSGGDDILIDDHGRYFAKMHFDLSDKNNGEATLPIRLTQAYSGSGYGIHFPNHGDTELLWACVDGNVDRPIGIGTIPNPSNASPSVDANKTQNVIRTAGNNEIIMEDKAGSEGIKIKDKHGNEIFLDAAAGTIRFYTPSHETSLTMGKSFDLSTISDFIVKVSKDFKQNTTGDYDLELQGNQTITVGKNLAEIIKGDHSTWYKGTHKINVDGITSNTHGGAVMDNYLGLKSSNYIAGSVDGFVAYKRQYNHSYEYKRSSGKVISRGTAKEDKELKDTVKIDSAIETKVIGGGGTADTSKMVLKDANVVINCGSSKIVIQKDGHISVVAPSAHVLIKSDTIFLNGKEKIEVRTPEIHAKKGTFESKNIKDLG
ncbi:MAG: type VI secretion system Vgr family protein [Ignavibacteria bacterium]